jgi:SAM-dependent methyltransferase
MTLSSKVSIYTPTHDTTYLLDAYNSIKSQGYAEWVIYPNNGLTTNDIPIEIRNDPRTKLIGLNGEFTPKLSSDGLPNIGSIKKYCCSQCSGDILVEFDHDDLLIEPGIETVKRAFLDPEVVFAYSNAAEFNQSDMSPRFFGNANAENNYDSWNGWRYRDVYYNDVLYKEVISTGPIPYNVSIILFAPNHYRAFRRDIYEKIGGYNDEMSICDDQDIMCRMFLEGKFYHVDQCCYLYRVTGNNSWLKRNADIQSKMLEVQEQYIMPMAEAWAKRNKFDMLDLGGRFGSPEGYISVDLKDAEVNCDLNDKTWPFEDSSVGVIRAFDVIEHLKDPINTMRELHRILRPGGYLFIEVPSTDGRGAFQDPTHVSYFNINSFFYYTRSQQAKYIDNTDIRFKAITLKNHYPSNWEKNNNIPYVRAWLICLKNDYVVMGHADI